VCISILTAIGCGDPPDPVGQCDLQLIKKSLADPTFGNTPTYDITVNNIGDANCDAPIQVTDSLPPHVTYDATTSSGWGCSVTSSMPEELDCQYASSLAPGASTTLELEVTVGDLACMASNCATVSNDESRGRRTRIDNSPDNNGDCAETICHGDRTCVDAPPDMVGWWTADQTALDSSGQSNDGTLQNGAFYTSGQVLESFGLDGDDDHVRVPNDASLNFGAADQFSIDAWIYPTDSGDALDYIVDKRQSDAAGQQTGYAIHLRDGALIVRTQSGATGVTHSIAGAAPDDQWTHTTVTVDLDADQGVVYLDGAQDSTFQPSSTGAGDLTNDSPLFIGQSYNGNGRFGGRIDEVEIFSRVLAANEVGALYKAGPCGKCRVDCEQGTTTIEAGQNDNFSSGQDSSSPSLFLQQFTPTEPFDSPQNNRHFVHTFDNLKPTPDHRYICGAELEIRLRPSGSIDRNDTLSLNFSDGSGNQVGAGWGIHLGSSSNLPGNWADSLFSGPWRQAAGTTAQTFNLDLANLPVSASNPTNLMPDLDTHAMLNVRVQDDSEIDYANLTVNYSCQPCDFIQPATDLAVRKSLTDKLLIGQASSYVVSVINVSNTEALPPVTVTDTVPDCLRILGIDAPWDQWCTINGQSISCEYTDPIPAGDQTPDMVINVVPTDACGDLVRNCADIEQDADSQSENNQSCVETPVASAGSANLTIKKRALTDAFIQTQNGIWEVLVTNQGPDTEPGPITVTDTLPGCMGFVGTSAPGWSCSQSGPQVTCDYTGSLAVGQSVTLDLEVSASPDCGDRVENCASVSSDATVDPDTSDNNVCTMATVKSGP
jgi:uncharacterized repeat protein (TIGR01451 family)